MKGGLFSLYNISSGCCAGVLACGLGLVGVSSGRLFHEDMKCLQEGRILSGLHL